MKFQLPIKTKIPTNEEVSCLSHSDVVLIMLINVKMPITFRSEILDGAKCKSYSLFFRENREQCVCGFKLYTKNL